MENLVIGIVLLVIIGFAARYVYKAKKNGAKCIGCPSGGCCSKSGGCCSCKQDNGEQR